MSLILIPDDHVVPDDHADHHHESVRARLRLRAAGVTWSTDANSRGTAPTPTFGVEVAPAREPGPLMFSP